MSEPLVETARSLYRAGRFDEALRAIDSATQLHPDRAELWNNRGSVLAAMNLLEEARMSFDRALSLKPNFVNALGNRANALLALGRFEEAAQDYKTVLLSNPGLPYGYGNLLHCRLQCCDWRFLDKETARMVAGVRANARVASPLVITTLLHSAEDQLRAARI